ncbi:MAG: tRNA dihydrouridine synthase DusB [Geminicoccaceae bacterium]|nr:tRNA dihydrouridine synthase DusB [Geminicoccaceae bacterium]
MTVADIFIDGVGALPPVLLAPMSGVSDLPFRRLARRGFGGLIFSEMIAGREMLQGTEQSLRMALFDADEPLASLQLAGRDPKLMADAARLAVDLGARLVDINFGCPVKKVVNGLGGSALMRDEPLAGAILDAVVRAVDIPVTVKMRLGWDRDHLNAPAIARRAEQAGVRMVTVHGRTRDQMYEGRADWAAAAKVREAISLPLVINGDIETAADAREAMRLSGADAVMIGRTTCGRPWHARALADALAGGREVEPLPPDEQARLLIEHYDLLLEFYGENRGKRIARKHLLRALGRHAGAADIVARLVRLDDPLAVRRLVTDHFGEVTDPLRARAA